MHSLPPGLSNSRPQGLEPRTRDQSRRPEGAPNDAARHGSAAANSCSITGADTRPEAPLGASFSNTILVGRARGTVDAAVSRTGADASPKYPCEQESDGKQPDGRGAEGGRAGIAESREGEQRLGSHHQVGGPGQADARERRGHMATGGQDAEPDERGWADHGDRHERLAAQPDGPGTMQYEPEREQVRADAHHEERDAGSRQGHAPGDQKSFIC